MYFIPLFSYIRYPPSSSPPLLTLNLRSQHSAGLNYQRHPSTSIFPRLGGLGQLRLFAKRKIDNSLRLARSPRCDAVLGYLDWVLFSDLLTRRDRVSGLKQGNIQPLERSCEARGLCMRHEMETLRWSYGRSEQCKRSEHDAKRLFAALVLTRLLLLGVSVKDQSSA